MRKEGLCYVHPADAQSTIAFYFTSLSELYFDWCTARQDVTSEQAMLMPISIACYDNRPSDVRIYIGSLYTVIM